MAIFNIYDDEQRVSVNYLVTQIDDVLSNSDISISEKDKNDIIKLYVKKFVLEEMRKDINYNLQKDMINLINNMYKNISSSFITNNYKSLKLDSLERRSIDIKRRLING